VTGASMSGLVTVLKAISTSLKGIEGKLDDIKASIPSEPINVGFGSGELQSLNAELAAIRVLLELRVDSSKWSEYQERLWSTGYWERNERLKQDDNGGGP
jgi:hypothetical protein